MRVFVSRFIGVALFFLLLTLIGTSGYMVVEGWSFNDALYMTATTLTAVGYSEVHPLSTAGRYFTMGLLAGGITGMGIWFALVAALIVELDLQNVLRRRRTMKEIESMRDHVIVCGAGRTGRQVVTELNDLGEDFVVVERDAARAERIWDMIPEAHVLVADATQDSVLEEAGIARARGLVTCLSGDTDNLFVCLSARDMSPELEIVTRASEEGAMEKLYRAGADHVVSPNVTGAVRMAAVLLRPTVVSFLDVTTRSPDLSLRLEETAITKDSPLAGKTLQEARIPQETGLLVIALRKKGSPKTEFAFNPVGDTRLDPGDEMIVLGRPDQILRLKEYANP